MATAEVGKLRNQVAVITGGGSGIGKASVELFAREGAKVIAADRKQEALQELTTQLANQGYEVIPVVADLASEEECMRVIDTALQSWGRIDILFNNIGITVPKVLHETTNDDYRQLMDVNVSSVFWCCKHALPAMINQRSGVILTTSSKTGIVAQRDSAIYCTTKGALISMMQAVALDYAPYGIRANAMCPGIIDTPLLDYAISQAPDPVQFRQWNEQAQPLGRLGTADECARAALFLCSEDASFITGVALPVDGGFTAQ
ncbi:SDR family NAD(P)-dependent oxidoreductase [Brevibacillus migulae]|uniref:SDR family NAD(P)-dependent oxidoreductase n=1 Tax=Brevibacillus migulae TaxID=1644114 RepID=UPI00143090BC|nr:SDR family oxidoreductase [Brevibacillus migulae]